MRTHNHLLFVLECFSIPTVSHLGKVHAQPHPVSYVCVCHYTLRTTYRKVRPLYTLYTFVLRRHLFYTDRTRHSGNTYMYAFCIPYAFTPSHVYLW